MTATALSDLRSRVADALDDPAAATLIPGISVLPDVVDSLTPPAYLLVWGNPWVLPSTFCSHVVRLDVVCIAERIEPAPGVETLELMLAVALDRLRAAGLPEATVLPPGPFNVGGVPYQAARLTIEARLTIPLPSIAPTMNGTAHLVASAVLAATGATTAPGSSTGAATLSVTATLSAVGSTSPPGTSTASALLSTTGTLTATGSTSAPPMLTGAAALVTTPALTATGTTSGAWTPASLPLAGWWDPSDAATITASAGAVSQLADKSGNGRHQLQATGTKQPTTGTRTIGGRNAILTAAGTGLVTAAFAQGPSFTVYAVVQGDSTAGQRAITDNDGSPRIGQQRWTGPDLEAIGFSGGTPKFATGTGATNPFALAAHFVAFVFDSAAQTITIEADGVQKAQVTSTGALNSGTLGFSFGNNLATNAGMVGAVGEVFLSAAADGTGARANALAYARTKWGTP